MRRIVVISLLLLFSSFMLIKGAQASEISNQTPKSIVWNYLHAIYEVSDSLPSNAVGDGFYAHVKDGQPSTDRDIGVGGNFGGILDHVSEKYEVEPGPVAKYERWGYWSFESVIVSVNRELINRGYGDILENLRGDFIEEFESFLPENFTGWGEPYPIDELLTEGRDVEGSLKQVDIYPVADVAVDLEEVPLPSINTGSMISLMQDWYIKSRISGESTSDIGVALDKAVELIEKKDFIDTFEDYIGHDYSSVNAEDLVTLFYFSGIADRLESINPSRLIFGGYGYLLDEIEAMAGKEFFKKEWNPEERKSEITVNNEPSGTEILDYLTKRMELTRLFLRPMSEYYGYDVDNNQLLDLSEPIDAGKVSAAVTEVFNRIRTVGYDPFEKEWVDANYESLFNSAKNRVLNSIEFAVDLKDNVGSAFNISLPIEKDTQEGLEARNFLNTWGSFAVDLKDYGVNNPLAEVRSLLPGGDKSSVLIEKINSLWEEVGEGDGIDINNELGRKAYTGFALITSEILSRPKYYGITEGDFDAAFDKVCSIITTGVEEGLVDVVADYFGTTASNLDLTDGMISGIYTFWNQVLEVKGMDFVKEHINVRKEIAAAMQEEITGTFSLMTPTWLNILRAFESKLNPADLENSKNDIIAAIHGIYSSEVGAFTGPSSVTDILEVLPDPSREALEGFYPPLPQVGPVADALAVSGENAFDNVNFESCSDMDIEDNDIVSVPISPDGFDSFLMIN